MAEAKRHRTNALPAATLLLFLLLVAAWFVSAGPALKKQQVETKAKTIQALIGNAGQCITHPSPHWLGLGNSRNPTVNALYNHLPITIKRWQKTGGQPKIDLSVNLSALPPITRLQLYQRLRQQELDRLVVQGATEADLEIISRLKIARDLELYEPKPSLQGYRRFPDLPHLAMLTLTDTGMTNENIKELGRIPSIKAMILNFSGSAITDAGMKDLASLKSIRLLNLEGTKVSDAGLKDIGQLSQLSFLSLRKTNISDAGIQELGGLPSLKSLNLSETAVTDTGMKEVGRFSQLQGLDLDNTQVTDAGLMELVGLKHLGRILASPKMTPEGIKAFQARKQGEPCQVFDPLTGRAGIEKGIAPPQQPGQ